MPQWPRWSSASRAASAWLASRLVMIRATSPRVDPSVAVLSRTIWATCLASGKVMVGSFSATWAVVRERCSSRP
jgi:hypothetical protein